MKGRREETDRFEDSAKPACWSNNSGDENMSESPTSSKRLSTSPRIWRWSVKSQRSQYFLIQDWAMMNMSRRWRIAGRDCRGVLSYDYDSWFQTINMRQATQTPFLAWLVHPSWPHFLCSFVAPCVTQTLPLMTLLHPLKLHCSYVTFAPCVIILPRMVINRLLS